MGWALISLILVFLPGFFLTKLCFSGKKIPLNLLISVSCLFSLAIIPVVFFIISWALPLQLTPGLTLNLTLTINFILFSLSFKKPWPKLILPKKKEAIFLTLILSLSFLILLAPYFRPHQGPFWSTYHFGQGRDILERIAVIVGLKKFGLLPKNPELINQPLNYYYFYHLNAAVLSVLSNEVISTELSHLLLSAFILIASSLLLSAFLHPLVFLILLLGYGFDFFFMIPALLKIHPYVNGLDHLDNWTAPFVKDLKVNPFSIWFTWAPHHTLGLFLFLIFIGIFFDQIKIKKSLKQLVLGLLTFSILGTSSYIFLGGLVILSLYCLHQSRTKKQLTISNYQFLLVALPFCLAFLLPMILRIKTPTIGFYPFWQFPRDHLFSWRFPSFPLIIKIVLLVVFLAVRFLVYLFDLGILFILAVLAWKNSPKKPLIFFSKLMLLFSVFMAIFIKSIPYNNDFGYRISGFSWLACAFLAESKIRKIWQKIKRKKMLLAALVIIVFSPTLVEQFVFPYKKVSEGFWQMKKFVDKNIPLQAIVQTPPDYSPASIYFLERGTIYSCYCYLFYPNKGEMEKIRQEIEILFNGSSQEAVKIVQKYQIDYALIKESREFKSAQFFEKVFENKEYQIYKLSSFSGNH